MIFPQTDLFIVMSFLSYELLVMSCYINQIPSREGEGGVLEYISMGVSE